MLGFSGAVPSRGSKSLRMSDVVDVIEWPKDGNYLDVRMIGPVYSIKNVWFNIATEQHPAPKGTRIPKMCIDWDGENGVDGGDFCPYRLSGLGGDGVEYWVNVIVRDLQNDDDGNIRKFPVKHEFPVETHLGYKAFWGKKGDSRKTPIRLLRIPDSQVDKLKNLVKSNKDRATGKNYELSDEKFGCDIGILENPNAKGAARFDIQKRDRTPITPEERRYLVYRPNLLKPDTLEAAKAEIANLRPKIITKGADAPRSPARGGAARPSARSREADDELIELDESDVDGELDDAPPSRGRAPARGAPPARSRREEPEDDLDGDVDANLDDDLDATPARGRTPAKPPARGRREELEDDLGLDDDGGEDLDADIDALDEPPARGRAPARNAPPARSRAAPPARSRREEPEDDLGLDDDGGDDLDAPPARGRAPVRESPPARGRAAPPARGSRRSRDDSDDIPF